MGTRKQPGSDAIIGALQTAGADGIFVQAPIRDSDGLISDFETVFCNQAAAAIVSRSIDDILGKRSTEVFPNAIEDGWIADAVQAYDTGVASEGAQAFEQDGRNRHMRWRMARTGDLLSITVLEITDLIEGEMRLRRTLDTVVAFVGVMDLDGILLEANEPALQAAGIKREDVVGKHFWDCYWWSYDTEVQDQLRAAYEVALTGEIARYDVRIRVGDAGERLWIDFQLAPLFDDAGRITGLIPSATIIEERKQTELQRDLLTKELYHRVKNSYAVMKSVARQTERSHKTIDSYLAAFLARLQAISAGQDLLIETEFRSADIQSIIGRQVAQYYGQDAPISLQGGSVRIPGVVATNLSLIIHELITNAIKYGALSNAEGRVTISWETEQGEAGKRLVLRWVERDGPVVQTPTHTGFGQILIQSSLGSDSDASSEVAFDPDGVKATFRVSIDDGA